MTPAMELRKTEYADRYEVKPLLLLKKIPRQHANPGDGCNVSTTSDVLNFERVDDLMD